MNKQISKIEELIAKCSSKGVAFKEIGEMVEFVKGASIPRARTSKKYDIPYLHYGDVYKLYIKEVDLNIVYDSIIKVSGSEKVRKDQYLHDGDIVYNLTSETKEDLGKAVVVINPNGSKFIAGTETTIMRIIRKDLIDPCFLNYLLMTTWYLHLFRRHITGTKVYRVHPKAIAKIRIPLPPLEVQKEIAKILNSFTELIAGLEAELETELEARKKQYKCYRDKLFNIKGVEYKTLGTIGTFVRGKRFVKSDFVAKGVPCIHYGEMYTHYNVWAAESKSFLDPSQAARLRYAHPGDVIIVAAGETVEDIGNGVAWLGKSDVVIHDACFAFTHNLNPKYVSYYLQTANFHSQIRQFISSGKISSINAAGLGKATIPVPPSETQREIVRILDKFNSLTNDISVALPAERAARRTQYEYYRSKLLTFKDANISP